VHFAFQQPILSCLATGMHFTIVPGPGTMVIFYSFSVCKSPSSKATFNIAIFL
jgi:hypothetical protein